MEAETRLIRYDAACRALAAAKAVDEVKDILDKAEALRAYGRMAKDLQLEIDAAEIRIRAERRLGELIILQKQGVGLNRGGRPKKTGPESGPVSKFTFSDVGISKNLSSRSQKVAGIAERAFEAMVERMRAQMGRRCGRVSLDLLKEDERLEHSERLPPEGGCTVEDLGALIKAGKKYAVIYADPPWSFNVYSGKGKARSADRHYDTQSLDDIKAFPVAELAADDCALLMWAVMPELPGALEVIKAWGFTYKTVAFTWIKTVSLENRDLFWGMGYWTRANAEVCLLATKGTPKRQAMDVHQVIMSPVSDHSRKPDEAQVRIERLLNGPYLELFARRATPGWAVWGNEISRSLFHQDIQEFVA